MSYQATFSKDNWHREAETIAIRNSIRSRRWGMRVTVYNAVVPADSGDYVLTFGQANTNRQSNLNWLKVADIGQVWGGGGGLTTADNGLTVNPAGNVQLGGTLLQDTIIDGGQTLVINVGDILDLAATSGHVGITADQNVIISAGNTLDISATSIIEILSEDFLSITGDNSAQFFGGAVEIGSSGAANGVVIYTGQFNTSVAIGTAAGDFPTMTSGINFSDVGGVTSVELKSSGDIELLPADELIITATSNILATTLANIQLTASGILDLAAGTYQLNGVSPATPETEFFRGDGTWAVPGGGGVTADNGLTLSAGNIRLGGALVVDTFLPSPTTPRAVRLGITSGFANQPLSEFSVMVDGATTFYSDGIVTNGSYMGIGVFGVFGTGRFVSDTNNTVNNFHEYTINTTGTVANGFGGRTQVAVEITAGLPSAITNEYLATDVSGSGQFQWNICIGNASISITDTEVFQSFNTQNKNIGFFTKNTSFGNGANVMKILNATTPANASVANSILLWAEDTSDATSSLALFTEQAVEAIGGSVADNKLKVQINGVEYWILLTAV